MRRMESSMGRGISSVQGKPRAFQRLRERYQKRSEEARLYREQLAKEGKREPAAFCMAAMPAAKVAELYGLDNVSGHAKGIVQKTRDFMKARPVLGWLSEAAAWSAIGFALTQVGAAASKALAALGPTLADAIGYTAAMVHPSLINLVMKRGRRQGRSPGISEYFQASSVTEMLAAPFFFGALGGVIHCGSPDSVSVGRGIAAAMAASASAFLAWCIGFAPYWARVIRKEKGSGIWKSLKAFCRGFRKPFEHGRTDAYQEAGRMAGTGFVIWAIPWYIIRAGAAAATAMAGVRPEAFNQAFFSITASLEGIHMVCSGVKNMMVKRIVEEGNVRLEKTEEVIE